MTFDDNSINEMILKQLALKFNNLRTLEMGFSDCNYFHDDNVLLFWQLLKPIISKNKTMVKLKVGSFSSLRQDECGLLSERMNEKDLKIDKLIIDSTDNMLFCWDGAIKLIQKKDNRGVNHLAIVNEISGNVPQELLDDLKCKSINTFELNNGKIKFVNQLLEWKIIAEKQLFVIIDVVGNNNHYNEINDDEVLSLFKQLYENVYQLFVQQIALDIRIQFRNVKDSKAFDPHLSLYSSFFENKEFLSKYNSPNCNDKLCLPRDKPYTYFYLNDSKKYNWSRYFVFAATNVQMK